MITKEFDYTHPLLQDGCLRFQFDDQGNLRGFQINAILSQNLLMKMIVNLPLDLDGLEYWKSRPSGKLTEYIRDISFDDFYNKFSQNGGQKRNRYRAEKIWAKLSQLNQLKAFNYIITYFVSIPKGTNPKYADSYLEYQVWND